MAWFKMIFLHIFLFEKYQLEFLWSFSKANIKNENYPKESD